METMDKNLNLEDLVTLDSIINIYNYQEPATVLFLLFKSQSND